MAESTNQSKNEESDEHSEDNLEIVIESPSRKRKLPPVPTESERQIIESIEEQLERQLEEKAAKSNLNAVHVKNIIKHVVTDDNFLDLIRNAENAMAGKEYSPVFEPKWTRSKAKELSSVPGVPLPSVPWVAPKPSSAVQALFTEDLQEDSSGDEYVPGMGDEEKEDLEESEDDRDSSFFSDPPSVEPPTPPEPPPPSTPPPTPPPICNDSDIQTNWTDDGIFKIPSVPKDKEETPDEATIARRTRSKLSLSSTPLEVIEEAFVPPDITTDMYEMYCDNEDWMNFLKTFTRPLEEVDKIPEEEELDPEYNVLSDEEVDKPDKEELRVDKAVKVSRKELNALIAELYEFCETEQAHLNSIDEDEVETCTFMDSQLTVNSLNQSQTDSSGMDETIQQTDESQFDLSSKIKTESKPAIITDLQITLLQQQMRQHVQMLTQNFLLTYQHSELHQHSIDMKEYLLNLKLLGNSNEKSTFVTVNLNQALSMVKYWEEVLASDTDEVKKMKMHVEKTICDSIKYKQTGCEYIPTFPSLILETISKSSIFLYPSLLPKIPFKSPKCFTANKMTFTQSEQQLIALGLEQFTPIANEECIGTKSKNKIYTLVSSYIHEYMLPTKPPKSIFNQINQYEYYRSTDTPIKYYTIFNKAPDFIQYVIPLEQLQVLPPCKRKPEELPYQWRSYIFPPKEICSPVFLNIYSGLTFNSNSKQFLRFQKPIAPNGPICSTPLCPAQRKRRLKTPTRRQKLVKSRLLHFGEDPITKFVECLSKPSNISKILELFYADTIESLSPIKIQEKNIDSRKEDFQVKCRKLSTESNAKEFTNRRKRLTPIKYIKNIKGYIDHSIMLPNMPSLCTPVKIDSQNEESNGTTERRDAELAKRNISLEISEIGVSNFQSSTSLNISETSELCKQENKSDDSLKDIQEDKVSVVAKPAAKKEPSGAEKKRAKLKKEFLANLTISTPEDCETEKQKNEMFAMAYYDKMRETLDIEAYHKIIQILCDYEEGDAVDIYRKVEPILKPKYKELADEFLLFLREKETAAVDRLVPWIRMNNRSKFLRKLETYFKDQPSQLRKVYQCLTELSQTVGVTMDKIKSTLVPMFKGNAVLTDLFLQNFLDEPPPPSLLEGPYEVIDINKELSQKEDEEPVEIITVPDVEDKYGGATCVCICHEIEDVEFKSRFRHCSRCGAKFLNGRVYIQTGRGLRPATVTFLTSSNADNQARLADRSSASFIQKKKRSDSSPSKQTSHLSSKENPDEETDEDGDKKKKTKRKPRCKKQKSLEETDIKDSQKKTTNKNRNLNKDGKPPRKRAYSIKKSSSSPKTEQIEAEEVEEHVETELEENIGTELEEQVDNELEDKNYIKPGCTDGQQKRLHEESCEEDQSAAGESSSEVKPGSPEQQTAESESEFCEESSQDNCESDSNSSTSSAIDRHQSYAEVLGQNSSWTREEDKIILEVFQTENDKDNAFRAIADQLQNRSVDEIKSRFDTLMDLLMKTVEDHRD